jgi:hypothetical protein
MKLKLLRDYMCHLAGSEVTYPEAVANLLIRRGIAEPVDKVERKDKQQRDYKNK